MDWNLREGIGNESPITRAVSRGAADILETILTVPSPPLDLEVMDSCGRGLAQLAVETGEGESERCVRLLSEDGRVDWNSPSKCWCPHNHPSTPHSPIMFCLKYGKMDKANILVQNPRVHLLFPLEKNT